MSRQHIVLGVLSAILVLTLDVVINPERILGMPVMYPWMFVSPADLEIRAGREIPTKVAYDDSYMDEYRKLTLGSGDLLGTTDVDQETYEEEPYEETPEDVYEDETSDPDDVEGDENYEEADAGDIGGVEGEPDDSYEGEPELETPISPAPPVGGEGLDLPPTPTSAPPATTTDAEPTVVPDSMAQTPTNLTPTVAHLSARDKLFILMQLQQGR